MPLLQDHLSNKTEVFFSIAITNTRNTPRKDGSRNNIQVKALAKQVMLISERLDELTNHLN